MSDQLTRSKPIPIDLFYLPLHATDNTRTSLVRATDYEALAKRLTEVEQASERYVKLTDAQIEHLGAENERLRTKLAVMEREARLLALKELAQESQELGLYCKADPTDPSAALEPASGCFTGTEPSK